MNVHGKNFCLQLTCFLLLGLWRFFILLDVEFAQQHDGLFPEDTTVNGIRLVNAWTAMVSSASSVTIR